MQKTNEPAPRRANLSEAKRAMLEKYLRGDVKTEAGEAAITPRFAAREELSSSQRRLFFLDHLQSIDAAYTIPALLRLEGALNQAALRQAFDEIIRRHGSLRTRFERDGQDICQIVAPKLTLAWPRVILDGLPGERQTLERQRLEAEVFQRPFALRSGPLARITLLKLGDTGVDGQARPHHSLLFTLHHIISDGWSNAILIREFIAIYGAFSEGRPSPLPELPIQYTDFAHWQKQWLASDAAKTQLAYWRRQLQGAPDTLALPVDRPRAAEPGHKGANHHFAVPDTLSAQLGQLSREHGVSLFVTLLAAFNVLLCRHAGQQDICVGTPVANRNREEWEGLIGFFVNTLALRGDLSGNPAFTDLLRQTGKTVMDAQAHQDLPFDKLVEALGGARDLTQTPLFQVMFVMQNTPDEPFNLPGLRLAQGDADTQTAKFDLTLLLSETAGGLRAVIEYNTALFDPPTITRLAAHYLNLLQGIVARPDQRIAGLPMLGPDEERQLAAWNATETAYPQGRWLHQLFERQAEMTPDAAAVLFEERFLSYAELNVRANQLAHWLRGRGVGPDTRVGVCMERSLEMVVALLGILKAGGAYVPLDPGYPPERLEFMMADVNAPVILSQAHLRGKLAASPAHRLYLDQQWPELAGEPVGNPAVALSPGHLAYCIYTSGSTGRPKGADVPHQGILNRLQWMQEKYRLDAGDRVLQKTPFSFDVSVWEFFWPLMAGAALVMAPPEQHKDSRALIGLVNRYRVTTLHFVPPMLQAFLDTPGVAGCVSLKRVVCSGEALPAELVRRFYRQSAASLHNLYGPTEASVDVSYWACPPDTGDSVPIGKPIANIALHVLDRHLNPLPAGIPGELHIGGVGLARGYLNRAALSAEKFIPDPFGAPGGRLYKTGDLTRRRADGNIEYLGRIDHQVKIRGFRIELGEIEARLREHPGVREAAVLARDTAGGGKQLVAYVVAAPEGPDSDALRAYLGEKLPEYMVPGAFVYLDALPLSANGKLDRKALPAPDGQAQRQAAHVAPRNAAEAALAEIWRQVLGVETVGVEDNFFALGGDSIRSLQVINLARERGIDLTLEQLYRRATLGDMAAQPAVPEAALTGPQAPFALIAGHDRMLLPAAVEDAYPLSTLQAGMIFHGEYDKSAYHLVDSIELRCQFDAEALQTAIASTVAAHPALRTAFDMGNYSEPLQLVFSAGAVFAEVAIDDWRDWPAGRQQEKLRAYLATEASRPFAIAQAPLIRFHVHRLDDDRLRFTVAEHHAILDGWSLVSMLNEIFARYLAALKKTAPPAMEPLRANASRDLVARERAAIQSGPDRQYWRQKLADAPNHTLPALAGQGADKAGTKQLTTLSPELTRDLRALAKTLAVPLKTVLLTAHLKVLGMLYGETQVTTGLVCSVRPEAADADRALGVFLNTLPFPARLDGGDWRDLTRRVFAAERELLEFRFYPLARIQRDQGRAALFDAMFYYLHYHVAGDLLQSGELRILGWDDHVEPIFTLGVAFHLDVQSERLQLLVTGDARKLSGAQVGGIAGYFVNILGDMAENPARSPARRHFLSAPEQQKITVGWNATGVDYPRGVGLHHCVEQQAARTPDAVAAVFGDHSLTHAQLNARANQLAHCLQAAGVGPDVLVGVCAERSLDMVVALLAILKAGGAYLPLDPEYPRDRLAFMLRDAGAPMVLTQAAHREKFADSGVAALCLDSEWDSVAKAPCHAPESAFMPENLAYCIYTSGSTGQPKGACVPHRGIVNRLQWMQARYALEPSDRILQKTPYSFDVSVWEFFWPLMTGAALVVAKPGDHKDSRALIDIIRRERVTTVHFVPSMLQAFVDAPGANACVSLKRVVCSGEALPADLAARFHRTFQAELHNLYGPTEASVDVSHWTCPPDGVETAIPIGRPIANISLHVLDRQLNPVPVGTAGELHIGGVGLGRGYLNRPGLTAEKFIPNPYDPAGGRLYKTGDLARYRADGNIDYLGRIDHQVKIRGFRIELGEIEARLLEMPAIKEAVAIAREDLPGDKRLVAYWVAAPGAAVDDGALRAALAETLPDYMIPAAFIRLDGMPLSANGKLDRGRLPRPDIGERITARYVAPRTATEAALAKIWTQVLGVENIGVEDGFFELGGHSLLATRLVSRICLHFKIDLQLKVLFEAASIARLAERVDLLVWAGGQAWTEPDAAGDIEFEDIAL